MAWLWDLAATWHEPCQQETLVARGLRSGGCHAQSCFSFDLLSKSPGENKAGEKPGQLTQH